ncbi:MAG: hypothetical protein ACXVYV_00500 [Gaiellales bacterium]
MSHQFAHTVTVRPLRAVAVPWRGLRFGLVVALFTAFWAFTLLSPGSLGTLWGDLRVQPPVMEAGAWLVAFPWAMSLAVWESAWPEWLRALLLTGFTIGWSFAFYPRPRARTE